MEGTRGALFLSQLCRGLSSVTFICTMSHHIELGKKKKVGKKGHSPRSGRLGSARPHCQKPSRTLGGVQAPLCPSGQPEVHCLSKGTGAAPAGGGPQLSPPAGPLLGLPSLSWGPKKAPKASAPFQMECVPAGPTCLSPGLCSDLSFPGLSHLPALWPVPPVSSSALPPGSAPTAPPP